MATESVSWFFWGGGSGGEGWGVPIKGLGTSENIVFFLLEKKEVWFWPTVHTQLRWEGITFPGVLSLPTTTVLQASCWGDRLDEHSREAGYVVSTAGNVMVHGTYICHSCLRPLPGQSFSLGCSAAGAWMLLLLAASVCPHLLKPEARVLRIDQHPCLGLPFEIVQSKNTV